jgi:phosphoserine aminotransferase
MAGIIVKAGSFGLAIFPTEAIPKVEKKEPKRSVPAVKRVEKTAKNHRTYNWVGKMSKPFEEKENSFESIG